MKSYIVCNIKIIRHSSQLSILPSFQIDPNGAQWPSGLNLKLTNKCYLLVINKIEHANIGSIKQTIRNLTKILVVKPKFALTMHPALLGRPFGHFLRVFRAE